jgi:hypothetical protein
MTGVDFSARLCYHKRTLWIPLQSPPFPMPTMPATNPRPIPESARQTLKRVFGFD